MLEWFKNLFSSIESLFADLSKKVTAPASPVPQAPPPAQEAGQEDASQAAGSHEETRENHPPKKHRAKPVGHAGHHPVHHETRRETTSGNDGHGLLLHVNSEYGASRNNRVGHHDGVDLKASMGDECTAIRPGHITRIENSGNAGLHVVVKDDLGYESIYCHLSNVPSGMQAGDWVEAGKVVGHVGTSGHSTGPHLHYAVNDPSGSKVNPLQYVSMHGLALPVHNAAYGAQASLPARDEAMAQVAQANQYEGYSSGNAPRSATQNRDRET